MDVLFENLLNNFPEKCLLLATNDNVSTFNKTLEWFYEIWILKIASITHDSGLYMGYLQNN